MFLVSLAHCATFVSPAFDSVAGALVFILAMFVSLALWSRLGLYPFFTFVSHAIENLFRTFG